MTGDDVIAEVRKICPETILSFSCGKDSIAAWLKIRDSFEKITPYYLYTVPGLEFVENSLDYYERFFSARIIRLPNPSLHRKLNSFVFQPPERCEVIEQAGLPEHTYEDIRMALVEDLGVSNNAYVADGVRSADSLNRRASIVRYGPITKSKKKYHPVFDMKKEDLVREFKRSGVKLPIDYKMFGRTFDGIDLRFLLPLKKNFPKDYQKILEWFPLADLEVFRYENR